MFLSSADIKLVRGGFLCVFGGLCIQAFVRVSFMNFISTRSLRRWMNMRVQAMQHIFWRMFCQQDLKSHAVCGFVHCYGEGACGRAAAATVSTAAVVHFSVFACSTEGLLREKRRQTASKEVNCN